MGSLLHHDIILLGQRGEIGVLDLKNPALPGVRSVRQKNVPFCADPRHLRHERDISAGLSVPGTGAVENIVPYRDIPVRMVAVVPDRRV